MKRNRVSALGSAFVLSIASLIAIAFPQIVHASSLTCTWTGAGDGTTFSNASNWSGCNSAAPAAGDILVFTTLGSGGTYTLNNDIGAAFGGVDISNTSSTSNTEYYISALTLQAGAIIEDSQSSTYTTAVTIGTSSSNKAPLTAQGALTIENTNGTGTGSIYAVDFYASQLNISGVLTIGSGTQYLFSLGNSTATSIVLDNGAVLVFGIASNAASYSTSIPMTLGGGSGSTNPEISFPPSISGNKSIATTYTLTGPITLNHNAYVNPSEASTVDVTGALSGSGYTLTLDGTQYDGTLIIDSSNNTSATPNGTTAGPNAGKTGTVNFLGGGSTTNDPTTTNDPKTPDTGFGINKANAWLPLIGSSFVAAGIFLISRKVKRPSSKNIGSCPEEFLA